MRTDRIGSWRHLCAIVILGSASANVLSQHVHGVIELGVVVEGNTVAVSLNAPLSDVAGFEHAPETDEQSAIIEQAAAMLSNADAMFGLAESANCKVSSTSVAGPAYVNRLIPTGDTDSASHDDDHHDEHESHGSSESGRHDRTDSSDHGHDDHEEHAEISANYEWVCSDITNVDALELRFSDGFANVETIEIQIITSAGAQVITAGRGDASVSLVSP